MTLQSLLKIVEEDLKETHKYIEFMKCEVKPMLASVGHRHFQDLHFFNLGSQFALEKIQGCIGTLANDSDSKEPIAVMCPFHEAKTPSCCLDYKASSFHCYGCNASGIMLPDGKLIRTERGL